METIDKKVRFDARISLEQKLLLEKAARIGGFRSLTDFMISTAQQRAKEIIQEREQMIASMRDSEIFFDAITHSHEPNEALIAAAKNYKEQLSE